MGQEIAFSFHPVVNRNTKTSNVVSSSDDLVLSNLFKLRWRW